MAATNAGGIGVLHEVHLNILDADPRDDAVLRLAAEHDGSISPEHGIGRAKAHLLTVSRSGDELAATTAVKVALDPDGRLGRVPAP